MDTVLPLKQLTNTLLEKMNCTSIFDVRPTVVSCIISRSKQVSLSEEEVCVIGRSDMNDRSKTFRGPKHQKVTNQNTPALSSLQPKTINRKINIRKSLQFDFFFMITVMSYFEMSNFSEFWCACWIFDYQMF